MTEKRSAKIQIYEAFLKGLKEYFRDYENEMGSGLRKSTLSHRISKALLHSFPLSSESKIDYKGSDILIKNGKRNLLSIVWSNTYLTKDDKKRLLKADKDLNAELSLGISIFDRKSYILLYRFEQEAVEYVHINKSDFSETLIKTADINEDIEEPSLFKMKRKRPSSPNPHRQKPESS